jgi:hypothetical protein
MWSFKYTGRAWVFIKKLESGSEWKLLKRSARTKVVHQTTNIFLSSEEAVAGYLTSLKDSLWPEGKRAGSRPR